MAAGSPEALVWAGAGPDSGPTAVIDYCANIAPRR